MRVIKWLMRGEETDEKHQKWAHPLVSGLITTVIINISLYFICEHYIVEWKIPRNIDPWASKYVCAFLLVYATFLIVGRSVVMGNYALYDLIWTCNVIMFTAALGLYINNQLIVCASYLTILVDQMQWFVDVFTYLAIGKWPIGVAKYVVSKDTPLLKKLTSSHHMWFVPLCFYITRVRILQVHKNRDESLFAGFTLFSNTRSVITILHSKADNISAKV